MKPHSPSVFIRSLRLLGIAALAALAGCGGDGAANPSGTLETPTVDLAPLVTGRVLRIGATEGQRVAAGDTLLVVDTELIRLRREEAVAARGGVKAQRRAVAAELEQTKRQLALLEKTRERVTALAGEGSATRQRVDELDAERDLAAARMEAASARLAAADAELERVAAGLALLDRQAADGVVLAPIDGTVRLRSAEPGEVATAGRAALRIADLSTLELRVYLEAADIGRLRLGQDLPVLVDARQRGGADTLSGRVVWISDEAEFTPKNAQTRNARAQLVYAVKLRVDNAEGGLHLGMPAEVRLP